MMFRVLVGVALLAGVAHAQAMPDPTPLERPISADTRIPVSAPKQSDAVENEKLPALPSVSLEQPIDPDAYLCGAGDTFELDFWGQQNFRLRLVVDLEGRTFIQKVGFVHVAGKSLSAVRKAIKDKVRANYPGLQFELTLAAPRTFLVHVVDNVKQPGIYSAHPVERLSTVLARAGGVTGSRRRIAIRHRDGSVVSADLVMYELTGDTKLNPFLVDGDVVTVPFAELSVTVDGAVRRPGKYELIASKDLTEALALAGGLSSGVTRSLPIRIVHRNEHQQEAFHDLAFAKTGTPNAALADDDRVLVPGSDDVQRSVLLIGAVVGAESVDAAATSKRLPYVEGDTVRSLIERAGGIKAPGDLRRSYIARPQAGGPPKVIPIDLDALLVRRDFHADLPIAMGDTIVIPPMQYSILVEGAVARAGLYNYNPVFGVQEYIAHAGGRTHNAKDIEDVRLIDTNGGTRAYKTGIKLSPGDAILVPERNWSRSEIVQLALAGAGLVLSGIAVAFAVTR